MQKTLVLDVVGLTESLLGSNAPELRRFLSAGGLRYLTPSLPAVTCTVQSSMLTGAHPVEHGIVGNGWYFRDLAQVWLWRQSNHLVRGEKVWDAAKRRNSSFRSAKLFFWYNMYSSADLSVTPRPMYTADGRKIPDIYTNPPDLRDELTRSLGKFPLFNFWGPRADISATRWIAGCTRYVLEHQDPTLTLVYLPHLDYDLQRFGPAHPRSARAVAEVDQICGELFELARHSGRRVIVLSEYGITPVNDAIYVNRVLRQAGLIRVREELGREQVDVGASAAFAVADHQVAHVYVADRTRVPEVARICQSIDGVERVLDAQGKAAEHLDHERAGELVLVSRADRWFSYYYWLDDDKAPDYARTVDIHGKPGYDPVELFLDPKLRFPRLTVGFKLLCRKVGFRTLLDVIPLDASLVRGSHGRLTERREDGPLLLSSEPGLLPAGDLHAIDVKQVILDHVFSVSSTHILSAPPP